MHLCFSAVSCDSRNMSPSRQQVPTPTWAEACDRSAICAGTELTACTHSYQNSQTWNVKSELFVLV